VKAGARKRRRSTSGAATRRSQSTSAASAIRTDETAHRLRLQQLIPSLVEEFGHEKPAEEIRACADAVLADFADVPVRSFVLTLAHRRARECLRDGTCTPLVASV
jgi:hypothetical protein